MLKLKPSELVFIDRQNYTELQSKDLSIHDINSILSNFVYPKDKAILNKISALTIAYLNALNTTLHEIFSSDYPSIHINNKLNSNDYKYIDDKIKHLLLGEESSQNTYSLAEEPKNNDYNSLLKKYYEIIPLDSAIGSSILIVIEEGFFTKLTKSKDELEKFILDCLSYQYSANVNTQTLLRMYLSLKVNKGYFDLLKLKIETPS